MGAESSANLIGAEVSVFSHATEDEEKVKRAVFNLIPEYYIGSSPSAQKLSGHYNDPLILMAMKTTGRKTAMELFRSLIKGLSSQDRLRLLDEVEDRVDESGNLYIRLDKQRAYSGVAVLNESDPIRIKFRFRIPHGMDPVGTVRAYIARVIDEIEQEPKQLT